MFLSMKSGNPVKTFRENSNVVHRIPIKSVLSLGNIDTDVWKLTSKLNTNSFFELGASSQPIVPIFNASRAHSH